MALYTLKDCEYSISGTKFTGCVYDIDQVNDGEDWIQYVTVSNFTGVQLQPNISFTLTLYFMNPWTAYTLTQKNISAISYNSLGQATSLGVVNLTSIYPNLVSFTPVQLSNFTLLDETKQCSQNNTLVFNISLPVNIGTQTYLYFIISMAYYTLTNQTGYEIESQNTTHYTVRRLITECTSSQALTASGLCMKAGDVINSTINVVNQMYLRILNPKPTISVYLYNDNNFVTLNSYLSLNDRVPNSISNTILQRTTGNVSQSVTSSVKFSLPNNFNLSNPIKVSISPINSSISFIQSIQALRLVTQNTSLHSSSSSNNFSLSSTLNGA